MKTLLILRHAKSSWKYDALPDHERPLNRRGQRDAPRMGRHAMEHALVPDHVLTSSAVRAQMTARLFALSAGYEGPVEIREQLYLSGARAYLDALREVPPEAERVLVVGHNPDVESLVDLLCGSDPAMPTAALAVVELPVEAWEDVRKGLDAKLSHLWLPKELP